MSYKIFFFAQLTMEGCRMKSTRRVKSSYNKIYRKNYYYHVAIHSGVRFCSCKLPKRHTGSRIQQDTKNLDSANAMKMWPKNHTELPNDTTHLLDMYYMQQSTISIVDCFVFASKESTNMVFLTPSWCTSWWNDHVMILRIFFVQNANSSYKIRRISTVCYLIWYHFWDQNNSANICLF